MEKDIKGRVLLADANEDFRGLLQRAIENTGEFTVVGSVGDGTEALRLIEENKPDLVLADVVLPGLDGFGLIRRAPKNRKVKFIVISAFCSDRTAEEAMRMGAEYFIPKPCAADALLERMRAALEAPEQVQQPAEL